MEAIENYDFGRILRDTKELTMGDNGSNSDRRNVIYPGPIPHYMHQVSKGYLGSNSPLSLQSDELHIFVQFKDPIPESDISSIVKELRYIVRKGSLTHKYGHEIEVSSVYLGVYDPNGINKENMFVFPGPFSEVRSNDVGFKTQEAFDTLAFKTDCIEAGSDFLERLHNELSKTE